MTVPRILHAYLMEAKYESLRMLRSPSFAGPFLLLPAGLYLLFGALLFGTDFAKDPKAAMFIFMGFSVLGVMGPESVPEDLRAGEQVVVSKAVNMIVAIRRP